jgi:DNA replication protein DnaC
LGCEENYKLYGNDMNVILDIMIERHSRMYEYNVITHVTSNLPPTADRLTDKYDARFESRCHEMFHFLVIKGKDYRKP